MKRILIALLLAVQTIPALADLVSRRGDDYLRLSTDGTVCAQAVRDAHRNSVPANAMAAVLRMGGKTYQGCWVPTAAGIFVFYDDGDAGGPMPIQMFQTEAGA